jgi:hypothetical protein
VGSRGELFDLAGWQFNEHYYMEAFDFDSEKSLPLLCAHIYWRALLLTPSLVRLWFLECKNRQLNLAVEEYRRLILGLPEHIFRPY